MAYKPKTVTVVAVPARNDPEADNNQPHNLPADDFASAYERTLAHELLHAVGVYHHGQGDHAGSFTYLPATYKGKNAGGAIFWMEEFDVTSKTIIRSAFVDVLKEKTRVSWAKQIGPAFDYILEQLAAKKVAADNLPAGTGFPDLDKDVQWHLIKKLPNFWWGIGVEHGQHSGYEQCLMRYEFAEVYKARGAQALGRETYYLVPQGTEDVGAQICEEDKGTGVNAPSWMPQSRYGDAANNFGKCKIQICVNDAIPLHKWGWGR